MSSESKFLLVADKFLESDASLGRLSQSFNQFLEEYKLSSVLLTNKDNEIETESFFNCILKYLHCIIEYAGSGNAQARSATIRQLCRKISLAVEELKIKQEFIKNLSLPIFEILFGQPSWIAKELLRMYSDVIPYTDEAVRLEVIQEKGPYYLGRLMDAITFGDFEFQDMIVETLYRICSKEILNDMPKVYFLTQEQTEAFHKIDTHEFDLTVRNFLNVLNEAEKHVVSLLCNKVTFDDIQLQEPPELKPFKGMWVDFNVTAGTITVFLDNEPFNKDFKWEMMTIFPEDISKMETTFAFNEERRKREGIAKLILKRQCQLCYTSSQHKLLNCRSLTLHSLDTERFREVFNQVFPNMHMKLKPKQPTALSYKRAYKPLDIISLKSSVTNPSTTFNATIDSITAGKKHKYKSTGRKSVTFADSTIYTESSKSRSISSKKSTNISLNQSIQAALEDVSLYNYKMKNLNKLSNNKQKISAELEDVSSNSNLSVLNLIETSKNTEKIGVSKKIPLSGLDNLSMKEHGTSKNIPYNKYNKEFLSNLLEFEENVNVFSAYTKNKNLERKKKTKMMQEEADSTTAVGGFYNNKTLVDDESITSNVFHSIEDIDNNDMEKNLQDLYPKKLSNKKGLVHKTLKRKYDNTTSQIVVSSLEKGLSSISADDIDFTNNEPRKKVSSKKSYSKILEEKQEQHKIIEDKIEIRKNSEAVSSLGIKLSPDLFTCESQELINDENMLPNKAAEIPKNCSNDTTQQYGKRKHGLLEMQEYFRIDEVRDCVIDEFDKLNLEKPITELVGIPKDENLPEPELIQISQPKFQPPLSTETEIFETARTNLDDEDTEVQWSANNLELFQDLSEENNFQADSLENSTESDFNLDGKSKRKIKILSDIQIHSPITKSSLSESVLQKLENKNSIFQEKENIKPVEEIQMSCEVSQSSCKNTNLQLEIKSSRKTPLGKNTDQYGDTIENITKTSVDDIYDIHTGEKHKVETAKITGSESQATVLSEKGVGLEETINSEVTVQEQQYSNTQKTDSQTTLLKYKLETSQKSHQEDLINCEEIFPHEEQQDIRKDPSQSNFFPRKNDYVEATRNCEETFSNGQPIDNLKDQSQSNSFPKKNEEIIAQKNDYTEATKNCEETFPDEQPIDNLKEQSQSNSFPRKSEEIMAKKNDYTEATRNCEETFPDERLDVLKDQSQSTMFPNKNEIIIAHINDYSGAAMNSEVQSREFQKNNSQSSSSLKNFEEKKAQCNRNSGKEGKKRLQIKDFILKKNNRSDSTDEEIKDKIIHNEPCGEDKVTQSFGSNNEIVEKLSYTSNVSNTKNKKKKRKLLNPKKPLKTTLKYQKRKITNDDQIPFVKSSAMSPTVKKNSVIESEMDEDDLPLSELKKHLKNQLLDENPKIQIDPNLTSPELAQFSGNDLRRSPDKDINVKIDVEIETNGKHAGDIEKSMTENKLNQKFNTNEKNENIFAHNLANITDIEVAEVELITSFAIEETEKITLEKTSCREDNVPYISEKIPYGHNIESQEAENNIQLNKPIPQQYVGKNASFNDAINTKQFLFNERNEIFDKQSENPLGLNLSKKIKTADSNKMNHPEVNKFEELEKSLNLIFGTEVNEPVTDYIHSTSIESLSKNDKDKNITFDNSNSMISGNVGMVKRGRKLFNPENQVENFLNFTIIEEKIAQNKNEEKPNELQSMSKHNEKKQQKKNRTSSQLDREDTIESKKVHDSDTTRQRKKQEKNESKKYRDLQKKQYRPSKLDFNNYSNRKRLDAFYDRVIEKLKSKNYSSRNSYSVTTKTKKSPHDSVGKYNLDFSSTKKILLENEEKFNHSTNKATFKIKEGDDGSKERNVIMETEQDDPDETMRVILRGLGTLLQNMALGTMKKPRPPIQKNILAAADLLLEL